MADFTAFRVALLGTDYPAKYDAFVVSEQGFANEIEAAREGQASLMANNLRYIKSAAGLTQALPANGWRITGLLAPVAASEPATKAYADALAFATVLPAQAGSSGLEITTNGTTASWGLTGPGAIAILNFIGY